MIYRCTNVYLSIYILISFFSTMISSTGSNQSGSIHSSSSIATTSSSTSKPSRGLSFSINKAQPSKGFGIGALEEEDNDDDDVYTDTRLDLSKYDIEMTYGAPLTAQEKRNKKKRDTERGGERDGSGNMDVANLFLGLYITATQPYDEAKQVDRKVFALPVVPKDFIPFHRFDTTVIDGL